MTQAAARENYVNNPTNIKIKKKNGKSPFLIADWRDSDCYPSDPLAYVDPIYLKQVPRDKENQSRFVYRIWRWEFLRRHPLYQKKRDTVAHDSYEFEKLFRIISIVPQPPLQKLNQYIFIKTGKHEPEFKAVLHIDPWATLEDHITFLKKQYEWSRRKNSIKNSMRRRQDEKLPIYLRVLDARAAGATYAEIARILKPFTVEHSQNDPKKHGVKLCQQAQEAQILITGVPY